MAAMPLLVTGALGLVGSCVSSRFQDRQKKADAFRQSQQLQATEEAKARQDRTALLQTLAHAVETGPAPAASCWYAEGIWADYSGGEPLPAVLAKRCPPDAGAPAAQWVIAVERTNDLRRACEAAKSWRVAGLENVQVLRDDSLRIFATTAGQFSARPDAIGYLQVVRAVHGSASITRQSPGNWRWCNCDTEDQDTACPPPPALDASSPPGNDR
jgi:hypothetical protein